MRLRTLGGMLCVLALVIVTVGAVRYFTSGGSPRSSACATATANQNAYVKWVEDNTNYPNDVDQSEDFTINVHDIGLLQAMQKANCPSNTQIVALPN